MATSTWLAGVQAVQIARRPSGTASCENCSLAQLALMQLYAAYDKLKTIFPVSLSVDVSLCEGEFLLIQSRWLRKAQKL